MKIYKVKLEEGYAKGKQLTNTDVDVLSVGLIYSDSFGTREEAEVFANSINRGADHLFNFTCDCKAIEVREFELIPLDSYSVEAP